MDFNANTGVTTTLPARYSTIYGDEISVRALLPHDSEFDVGANFMSAHYDDFSGPGFNFDGNQLIDAPKATVNAGFQHTLSLGGYGDLLGRIQTHYESGHWGVFSNAPGTHQFAYTKSDFRLTYTPLQGRWSVQAYVNNIENQAVFGPLSPGGQPGPATGFLEPPRTYGLRFLKSWG